MCCNGFVICMWSPCSFQYVLSLIYCTCVVPNLLYLFCPQFVIFVLSLIYVVLICCRSINMVQDAVPEVAHPPPPQKNVWSHCCPCVIPMKSGKILCHPHVVPTLSPVRFHHENLSIYRAKLFTTALLKSM